MFHNHTTCIHNPLSRISTIHYLKLFCRSTLFFIALILYLVDWRPHNTLTFGSITELPLFLIFIWIFFFVEMILRFFPSNFESMGCQKQFAQNYHPIKNTTTAVKVKLNSWKSTLAVAIAWILLNVAIGKLYFLTIIDKGILLLISLAYSVCDMICILFFCPFQTWFMKNKCCTTCRIYNWDFAMMFTPFVFIPNFYTWSLLFVSLGLLAYWELSVYRHPERFLESSNDCLSCKNCQEKLCQHKKQLQYFLKKRKQLHRN